jgi:sec-independent protein translocase protein TatC
MPIGPARMPLFDHLGELRMRLIRIVVVLFIAICVFYMAAPTIYNFMTEPVREYMGDAYILDVFGAFSIRFKVALWASVVACMPIIIWQILAFFLPALRPKERKWFIPTFFVAVALFIIGTVFCYLFILDPAVQWLTEQSDGYALILADANKWIDVIINFEIAFGFAFELPLVVFYLVVFEIIASMVTLDASPVTMLLMFAALLVLYEGSLLIARIVLGKRVEEQKREMEQEAAEDADFSKQWEKSKAAWRKRMGEDEDEEEEES